MNDFDLLARWLNDDMEVHIHHMYGTGDFEFRVNYKMANLDHLPFFGNPLGLCQDAAALIDGDCVDLSLPVAGRILTVSGQVLFQYFPGPYGFSARFSKLSEDRYNELVGSDATFNRQVEEILRPGWHDAAEVRFTKFELLRDKFNVEATDALEIVRAIEKELSMSQRSGPQNAGGHTSDHFTWYQNGLDACEFILAKYGR